MKEMRKLHSIWDIYVAINMPFDPKEVEMWLAMDLRCWNMYKNLLITAGYIS